MTRLVRTRRFHAWDLPPSEAAQLQKELSAKVIRRTTFDIRSVRHVAGVDVHFAAGRAIAAAVVLKFPELDPVAEAAAEMPLSYPYVPGLLSFREGPAAIEAVTRLAVQPDVLVVDGQGAAHPRRFGIASHIGLVLDMASVGCAKSRLVGRYLEPGPEKGDFSYLRDRGHIIGAVVRTRDQVAPVFVSSGHRISLSDGIRIVLACCRGVRLPETIRRADRRARLAARQADASMPTA